MPLRLISVQQERDDMEVEAEAPNSIKLLDDIIIDVNWQCIFNVTYNVDEVSSK